MTDRATIGGVQSLPKEVQALCQNARLKAIDVAEYVVGDKEERISPNGTAYQVTPVYVLDRHGRKYSGDVVLFNE